MKTIQYYFSPPSPWSYLGHDRLLAIAAKHEARVEPRPIALGAAVFPISGGLPLKERPAQRQAYRLVELQRWSDYLNIKLNPKPKHFPVADESASLMLCATIRMVGEDAALRLLRHFYQAVWADERNIADRETLIELANAADLAGTALYEAREGARELYNAYTQEAIDQQVFGAPWYIYQGEPFWGQDRLDFLDRALAADQTSAPKGC